MGRMASETNGDPDAPRYSHSTAVAMRRVGDEVLLVGARRAAADLDAIFVLDEVGAAIWGRLDGRTTVQEIGRALAAEFEVSEAQAAADALAFVEDLERAGLVEKSGQGRGP